PFPRRAQSGPRRSRVQRFPEDARRLDSSLQIAEQRLFYLVRRKAIASASEPRGNKVRGFAALASFENESAVLRGRLHESLLVPLENEKSVRIVTDRLDGGAHGIRRGFRTVLSTFANVETDRGRGSEAVPRLPHYLRASSSQRTLDKPDQGFGLAAILVSRPV